MLLEQYVSNGNEFHILADEKNDGKETRIAVVVLADPGRDLELEGSFIAGTREFDNLGGLQLLVSVASSVKNLQARTIDRPKRSDQI